MDNTFKFKVYCYQITDAHGNKSVDVVTDISNSICVYGKDTKGEYQQFDSTEAYHVYKWAEKHGFTVRMEEKVIEFT